MGCWKNFWAALIRNWLPGLSYTVSPPIALWMWDGLYVMSCHRVQRCRLLLYSQKLQMDGANSMCCATIRYVDSWAVCCDGCCVSHQHPKNQNTWVVASNCANFWRSKTQNRGREGKFQFYFELGTKIWFMRLLCVCWFFSFWWVFLECSSVLQINNQEFL